MYKGYKIRLYPNKEQSLLLDRHFGAMRWVYNEMIIINQKKYHRTGKTLSGYDMQSYLPKIKKQHIWLKEVNACSLQMVCHNLGGAYKKFFKKQGGYPCFKKRNDKGSFSSIKNSEIVGNKVRLPKLGLIKFRGGKCPEGKVKRFTVTESAGKYYASVLIETSDIKPELLEVKDILGIDLGIKDIVVTSNGNIFQAPRYTRQYQVSLRRAQKALSRCKTGGRRRKKVKLVIATIHQKIGNSRKDFNHKLSRTLVNGSENQAFAVESLNVKGMMANHKLAKSIADSGWHQFLTLLKYKADAAGKPVLEVGRFFPSSKTCSACGVVKESLKLSEREWVCDSCDAVHSRDINASVNIALEAARNAVHRDGIIPNVLR